MDFIKAETDAEISEKLAEEYAAGEASFLVVAGSHREAKKLAGLSKISKSFVLDEYEEVPDFFAAKSRDDYYKIAAALNSLASGKKCAVFAPKSMLERKLAGKETLAAASVALRAGEKTDADKLAEKLFEAGYERADFVYARGEFARRGDIVDVYPSDEPMPIRITFAFDEIEKIRGFNPVNQKSESSLTEVEILPEDEAAIVGEKTADIFDYLKAGDKIFIKSEGLSEVFISEEELTERKISASLFTYEKSAGRVPSLSAAASPLNKRSKATKPTDDAAPSDFQSIRPGDIIVHEDYGVGRFMGLERIGKDYVYKDYLKIAYHGDEVLYVPPEGAAQIEKYIGTGSVDIKISLSRLSARAWARKKKKTREDIRKVAEKLVHIYAERSKTRGFAFAEDSEWQKSFEENFPFEETEDQLKAIAAVKKDMEKQTPMDRLILGDVGYGKTEIAIRAAFKCADNGKQTAVLAPTTILAAQHFETFKERFQDYPFRLEHISRFQTKSEQARIVRELEAGRIDIIIGTHRILGKDVAFKDLGLLAIDEEQRFGVMQKERLREKHSAVDTISFSATPIPRTLNMSFAGIYDYNLILRPPVDRLPVKTFAAELSEDALAYAIKTELVREGQVFCVVDKIELIETYAEAIGKLFPEAKIGIVHGRLPRDTAERTVMKFALKKINILIGTTILESGLDIGNANTMVILNADNFGLSTLYQLRGRVGRRSRQGYCYLFYEKADSLTEIQEKRINAILHFTEFGAGFKIAMKDMEIRGSGNLLGKAQTGHIAEIGYNLYNKLVAEELAKLSAASTEGEDRGEAEDAAEEISANVNLPVSAYIAGDYIEDYEVKLDFYRRIAEIKSEEEKSEMLSELTDRFGASPCETQNLLDIALIKSKATELKWENVSYNKARKSVVFSARGRRTAIEASENEAEILLEAKKFLLT